MRRLESRGGRGSCGARVDEIVVRRGGHGAIYDFADQNPAMMELMLDYLKTGNMAGLPSEIALKPPKFTEPQR